MAEEERIPYVEGYTTPSVKTGANLTAMVKAVVAVNVTSDQAHVSGH
jgi:hypothetical protein